MTHWAGIERPGGPLSLGAMKAMRLNSCRHRPKPVPHGISAVGRIGPAVGCVRCQ